MSRRDLLSMVVGTLRRMKLRVTLTALGVVVGTTAIIAMVALGIGLQSTFETQLLGFQALNQLTVLPGSPGGGGPFGAAPSRKVRLDEAFIRKAGRIEHVSAVEPIVMLSGAEMKVEGRTAAVSLVSSPVASPVEVARGRTLSGRQERAAVVGNKLWQSLERDGDIPTEEIDLLGRSLLVTIERVAADGTEEARKVRLRVVGVAKEQGIQQEDFSTVYIPPPLAQDLWEWQSANPNILRQQGFDQLRVTVDSAAYADEVEAALSKMGVFVFSLKQILEQLNSFFRVVQVILGAIGGVALLVASLGIVNTMVMSIYERTREIGIMKAVGASNKDVIRIFLTESGVIGLIGGIGGAILGWLVAKGLDFVADYYLGTAGEPSPLNFVVPVWLTAFGISFAALVGVVAGIYPALRAARLDPLVALRHE